MAATLAISTFSSLAETSRPSPASRTATLYRAAANVTHAKLILKEAKATANMASAG